jgi:hypothetical protein
MPRVRVSVHLEVHSYKQPERMGRLSLTKRTSALVRTFYRLSRGAPLICSHWRHVESRRPGPIRLSARPIRPGPHCAQISVRKFVHGKGAAYA